MDRSKLFAVFTIDLATVEKFRSIYPFRVPVKAPFARLETLKFTLVIVFKMHSITDDLQTGMAQVRPERSKSTG